MEVLKNFMKVFTRISRVSLIVIWEHRWLLAFSFSLLAVLLRVDPVLAAGDPAAAIEAIETLILPSIQRATDWSYSVGLQITAAFAFYALIVRLSKMGGS